jgi:C4-type Zn-finger protein
MHLTSSIRAARPDAIFRSVRSLATRPSCPVCPGRRGVRAVRLEIDEIPGLDPVIVRDWRCDQCGATIRMHG